MKTVKSNAVAITLLISATVPVCGQDSPGAPGSSLEIFNRRLLPIFQSSKPSSCVQCHLASVDLKAYILPSQQQTFVALRDQGLIDLDRPAESKILGLIRMGDKDLDEGARLIHKKLRDAEYQAFFDWISVSAKDPELRRLRARTNSSKVGPGVSDAVIRHARKSRVVDSFARNVWSQRMRCFPCHTPDDVDPNNPAQAAARKTLAKLKSQYKAVHFERLGFFKKSPEESLEHLVATSMSAPQGTLPMLNLEIPQMSLLVQKPLSKLPKKRDDGSFEAPSSATPVSHMGGLKMHLNDHSYKAFVAWIQDYARVVQGVYKNVAELPADNWLPTKQILRLTNAPKSWEVGHPVQLVIYAKQSGADSWEKDPLGFTQGTINPRGIVNGAVFKFGDRRNPETAAREASVGRGDYLVKVFVDRNGQIDSDPSMMLGQASFVGQTILSISRWREGFRQAKAIDASTLEP